MTSYKIPATEVIVQLQNMTTVKHMVMQQPNISKITDLKFCTHHMTHFHEEGNFLLTTLTNLSQ